MTLTAEIDFAIAQLTADEKRAFTDVEKHLRWYLERHGSLGRLALAKVGAEISTLATSNPSSDLKP